jgi:hypothetical protein
MVVEKRCLEADPCSNWQHNTGKPKYVQTNLQFLNHVIIIKGFLPSYICDLRWFSLFCLASLVLFSCSQRLLNSLVFSVHNEGYSIDVYLGTVNLFVRISVYQYCVGNNLYHVVNFNCHDIYLNTRGISRYRKGT